MGRPGTVDFFRRSDREGEEEGTLQGGLTLMKVWGTNY